MYGGGDSDLATMVVWVLSTLVLADTCPVPLTLPPWRTNDVLPLPGGVGAARKLSAPRSTTHAIGTRIFNMPLRSSLCDRANASGASGCAEPDLSNCKGHRHRGASRARADREDEGDSK